MRAHNGVIGTFDLEVKNYARPDSFDKSIEEIPFFKLFLYKYKKEVCNICEFFTIYDNEKKQGKIELDENGKIKGIPNIKNISRIEKDINILMNKFPYPLEIEYEKGYVRFNIEDRYKYVEYHAQFSYEGWDSVVAPHWRARIFYEI